MPLRIEDYAMIGDCHSSALVGRDGSIDWLCWPRFDSGACFTAILGTPEHGRWLIAPAGTIRATHRQYRDDTLILQTIFETDSGAVLVIDFMPMRDDTPQLVRIVKGLRGKVEMRMELTIRFDYGAVEPWVSQLPDGSGIKAVGGPNLVVLRSPVNLIGKDMKTVSAFTISRGETIPFVMAYGPSHLAVPKEETAVSLLRGTHAFWRKWCNSSTLKKDRPSVIRRSLIVLKALTYLPTGGVVAAPTTSLPEQLGGPRNWDYRYCWLRDAAFTVTALMGAGYFDEAHAWRQWLQRATAGSPSQIRTLYGIAGERLQPEWEVPWLPGYENSKPVLIGNAAVEQRQLDVYGQLMGAIYVSHKDGYRFRNGGWEFVRALIARVEEIWREPDDGIWEFRSGERHFVHSKVMAWFAIDCGVRLAEKFKLEAPVERWRVSAAEIHADVCARGYDSTRNSFMQSYGSKEVDAALLLMPVVGFLPPEDPRVRGTVAAIEKDLIFNGLVMRYRTEKSADGFPPGEGAFLACSFWLVDNMVLQGRLEEAQALFDRVAALANDVGLISEQYDRRVGRMVGNFPQAFSHIALINSALNLARARGEKAGVEHARAGKAQQAPVEKLSGQEAPAEGS
ncbi:MAG TPA: glycoside hydrolase family 15 protein [Burkholderiales bacterium]